MEEATCSVWLCKRGVFCKEIQQSGGLVTEFLSGTKSNIQNFAKRNSIVAGLSYATIVFESA